MTIIVKSFKAKYRSVNTMGVFCIHFTNSSIISRVKDTSSNKESRFAISGQPGSLASDSILIDLAACSE